MSEIFALSPQQTRQYIDAETVFLELQRVRREAAEVRGSMFWRTQGNGEYLIRESSGGGQKSLGPRTPETEQIYQRFKLRKEQAQSRLAALLEAAHHQQRLNKALRVGRVPGIVIKTLNALQAAGLQDHFMTIGTHSLYAYESACGVRFSPDAMATQDIDLLFDSRKRILFSTQLAKLDSSMLGVLKKVDSSFRMRKSQKYTAVNKDGFEVDIIRRERAGDDPHPIKLSDEDEDFWVAQARRANVLLDSPVFSAVIVATNGTMARMNTMHPATFVVFKRWMANQADREALKRRRDVLQADAVQTLLDTYLPQT